RRCCSGLGLATTSDTTAAVLAFPAADGGYDLLARMWVPRDTVPDRTRRDRVPYDAWVRDGWLFATPGNVTDYSFIRADLNRLADRYEVVEVVLDPWNATHLAQQLADDGFTVVEFRQGYASMSPAAKEFERLVMAGRIRHGGHPVLRWMANNVAIVQDPAGNIKPDKARSREKIDGIVAAIMAIGRAMVRGDDDRSVYEDRGVLVFG